MRLRDGDHVVAGLDDAPGARDRFPRLPASSRRLARLALDQRYAEVVLEFLQVAPTASAG
jgi:hypothetical protein